MGAILVRMITSCVSVELKERYYNLAVLLLHETNK